MGGCSFTAVIPYLGAWLGAVPAVLVAFSISPTAVGLTGMLFAVPTLAVLRVLFDFFRVRLRTEPAAD